jgi:hypothetical protein
MLIRIFQFFYAQEINRKQLAGYQAMSHFLIMTHTIFNPVIYAGMDSRFRTILWQGCCCFKKIYDMFHKKNDKNSGKKCELASSTQ